MVKPFKEICNKEKFLLNHDIPEDFVRTFWQKTPEVKMSFIIFRAATVVYMSGSLILVCAFPSRGYTCEKNIIYFTYWAYLTQILAFVIGFSISVQRYKQQKKNPDLPPLEKMPSSYKVMWVVYNIASPCALGVTMMFWIFVYNPDDYDTIVFTLFTHVFNSVTLLTDFCVAAIPYRFLHVYFPGIFSFIYAIFSVIYQSSGGTGSEGEVAIYEILDWRYPGTASATCAVTLGCIIIMHFLLCVVNTVKKFFRKLRDRGIGPEEVPDA